MIKNIFLYLWQLPQNLLGLFVIFCTKGTYCSRGYWITPKQKFGVSLGKYIIFGGIVNKVSLKHEQGHQKQSLYLGWFYLLIIGLPSFLGNIYDRIFHRNWSVNKRLIWYYNQPWEKWADELSKINRNITII